MFTKWNQLENLQKQLEDQVSLGNVSSKERAEVQKNLSKVADILVMHKQLEKSKLSLQETVQQAQQEQDVELVSLFQQEIEELKQRVQALEKDLEALMYISDELDNRNAFLEIRAGTGGQEAALFVADLLRMYLLYAEKHGWKAEINSESGTDLGGLKEVIVYFKGKNVYGTFKTESGVHRVQRVPATETAGRVHTSTATVAVLPEAEDVDVQVNETDLRIDVYRSGGAGGQHVNTTDSAVRITHIPTGVVVACQDERSQHKNKAKALKMLKSRLFAHAQEKQKMQESKNRKEQVGTGERSEKIRTYNYPQNRVTDHRVDLTLKALDFVMQGDLDGVIEALAYKSSQNRHMLPILAQLD